MRELGVCRLLPASLAVAGVHDARVPDLAQRRPLCLNASRGWAKDRIGSFCQKRGDNNNNNDSDNNNDNNNNNNNKDKLNPTT